jgi:hypothetical protein
MQTYYRKAGERPRLPFTLSDANGAVQVPNTATVRVRLRAQAGGPLILDGLAAMDADQTTNPGKGFFEGADADLPTAGVFYGEVVVTWADASSDIWPNDGYFKVVVGHPLP